MFADIRTTNDTFADIKATNDTFVEFGSVIGEKICEISVVGSYRFIFTCKNVYFKYPIFNRTH